MKIDIIVSYIQRYRYGHEVDFVPPITGIHLAAITPKKYQVNVIHQQVDKVNLETDADLIAISFFSGFAPEAYRLAKEFKKRGKTVVAGGPHVTYCPDESLLYFDAIVKGEAEVVWESLLRDFENGKLLPKYEGQPTDLKNIPTPRYDLLPKSFFVKRVVQATRGCPYKCSFCTVPTLNPGFRLRPVNNVLKDIIYDDFQHWWQRKIVWFWDDNLTINRKYIKELLRKMIPLKKWWLTQASIDIADDSELLDLMKTSGCIGIFLGIETFDGDSLTDANKKQNKIKNYKKAVKALHKRGICVMAGLISGFDHDKPEGVVKMADKLMELGIDVPYISILTPYKGTALYERLVNQNRILNQRGWEFYNGYNVTFIPSNMTPEELLGAHRRLWQKSFSFKYSVIRIIKSLINLRFGAFCLSLFMNGFYGYKRSRQNFPKNMSNYTKEILNAEEQLFMSESAANKAAVTRKRYTIL